MAITRGPSVFGALYGAHQTSNPDLMSVIFTFYLLHFVLLILTDAGLCGRSPFKIKCSAFLPPVLPVPAGSIDNRYTGVLWQQCVQEGRRSTAANQAGES